ncbi:unnamed protein product, partial [Mycena citricolor]
TVWNMFFHMKIDEECHRTLATQCQKLLDVGETLEDWARSSCGEFIRFGTQYTLAEVRRHWMLYIGMVNLPEARLQPIRAIFSSIAQSNSTGTIISPVRSAGLFLSDAIFVCSETFQYYWKTGTTSSRVAEFLNPTF